MPARTAPYPSFTFSRGWALIAKCVPDASSNAVIPASDGEIDKAGTSDGHGVTPICLTTLYAQLLVSPRSQCKFFSHDCRYVAIAPHRAEPKHCHRPGFRLVPVQESGARVSAVFLSAVFPCLGGLPRTGDYQRAAQATQWDSSATSFIERRLLSYLQVGRAKGALPVFLDGVGLAFSLE
jgi:hypothetical protein